MIHTMWANMKDDHPNQREGGPTPPLGGPTRWEAGPQHWKSVGKVRLPKGNKLVRTKCPQAPRGQILCQKRAKTTLPPRLSPPPTLLVRALCPDRCESIKPPPKHSRHLRLRPKKVSGESSRPKMIASSPLNSSASSTVANPSSRCRKSSTVASWNVLHPPSDAGHPSCSHTARHFRSLTKPSGRHPQRQRLPH